MKFDLKILDIKLIRDLQDYWTIEDYFNLLEAFDFSESKDLSPSELRELLEMVISDCEPRESAKILLQYKLGEQLNEGQIQNLSNEMLEDNESEENADISLHYPLFAINQLLYKSYNGTFPNAKATKIEIELTFIENKEKIVTKELVLQTMSKLMRAQNLIIRLYEKELNGKVSFVDAENIIWEFVKNEGNTYTIITSDNWINNEDLVMDEVIDLIEIFED